MNQLSSLSPVSKLTVAALLVAAAGFLIQIVSGVEVPTVPLGLVILLAGAAVVALLPWRWIPMVGAAVGLFLLLGFFASGAVGNLFDPSRLGVLVGAWVQFLAVIAALAGIVATIQNYRVRGSQRMHVVRCPRLERRRAVPAVGSTKRSPADEAQYLGPADEYRFEAVGPGPTARSMDPNRV
jgi:hypothetical protein